MLPLPTVAKGIFFSRPPRPAKDGPPRLLFNEYQSQCIQGMMLTHLHLAPRIRISGPISPLPPYAMVTSLLPPPSCNRTETRNAFFLYSNP